MLPKKESLFDDLRLMFGIVREIVDEAFQSLRSIIGNILLGVLILLPFVIAATLLLR